MYDCIQHTVRCDVGNSGLASNTTPDAGTIDTHIFKATRGTPMASLDSGEHVLVTVGPPWSRASSPDDQQLMLLARQSLISHPLMMSTAKERSASSESWTAPSTLRITFLPVVHPTNGSSPDESVLVNAASKLERQSPGLRPRCNFSHMHSSEVIQSFPQLCVPEIASAKALFGRRVSQSGVFRFSDQRWHVVFFFC